MVTDEQIIIKIQRNTNNHLLQESQIYDILVGGVGIPIKRSFSRETEFDALVIDRLGPSLQQLFEDCNRQFTLKTVLMLADQIISRIEYLHERSVIHGDVKPLNCVMGVGKRGNQVYLLDFGLASMYRDPETHVLVPSCDKHGFKGTAMYASINAHLNRSTIEHYETPFDPKSANCRTEHSRRDDLESLGYMMVHFCFGSLPWESREDSTAAQRRDFVANAKRKMSVAKLCCCLPGEFVTYFEYVRSLRFEDAPDYAYLRNLFRDLFVRQGFQKDSVFDWTGK